MKISLTRKHVGIIILLIIIIPIVYNKTAGAITGFIQRRAMMMPKEVIVDNPHIEEINVSAEVKKDINNFLTNYYEKYTGLYTKSKHFLNNLLNL